MNKKVKKIITFAALSGAAIYVINKFIDYAASYRGLTLNDDEIRKYRYNPKMLSFDLYGTTRLYYVILLMNDLCDIHKFDLKNNNLLLLTKSQMANSISKIYKADSFSIAAFNNNHKNPIE